MSNEERQPSDNWTWEPSPKKEFNRRRLERCLKLDYQDNEYKEACLDQVENMKYNEKKSNEY